MIHRRSFVKTGLAAGSLAALGDLGFLSQLRPVSAADARLDSRIVRFGADIEPVVRFLEETPRDRVLQELGVRVRQGLSYRELVAGLMLAGIRNIQPRPVGFKFHAVLVVNSAHLASLASVDSDRWLPIFWAVDQFKSSQAADVREGDWTMAPVDEAALPPSHRAKQAFIESMDNWDEAGADVAIVALTRAAGAHELFEIFSRFGMRDFRDIGHKAIYVANSFRTLEVIGWQHAEPILRSLAYALLDRSGANVNPAKADLPADRPFRHNREVVSQLRADWTVGRRDPEAAREILAVARTGSPSDASARVVELINRGVSAPAIYDGIFQAAGELLMRAPGILSLHASTCMNALHYAYQHSQNDETRRLLLLQSASFLPLFRGNSKNDQLCIDALEPVQPGASSKETLAEIFSDISTDRLAACRKMLGFLQQSPDPSPIMAAARRLVFLKGNNSHDYKFSSAVLEDFYHLASPARERFLAAGAFYFRGSGGPDNDLVGRIRSALQG